MKFISFFLFIYGLFMSTFVFAQEYTIEGRPNWVNEVDTVVDSKVSKYDVLSGYYVSIADYQINLAEDAYFTHEVTNVISFNGITNASQLAITYDTSYQKLMIHHLYIWRNGKKIKRTKELKLEILNNEQNLHMGIYTGKITAYSILEDIRKDDRIDFAYTLTGNNPIFNNEKYLFFPLENINPIDYYSLRVVYPADSNYLFDCVDCDSNIVVTTSKNEFQQIEIVKSDMKALKLDESMPIWIIPYEYFILSSLKSWGEVNKWAEQVFSLKKEQNLQEVFDEIFTGAEIMDEKIDKIIKFVQNDIRYMGIESGIGSIKPFCPEQVVKQRFGDCKDKSLLLVKLLEMIGIEDAYPALLNVGMQHNISQLIPGVEVFNHCIVYFEHDSNSYWIDPSIAQQGGSYKNIYTYDYGKALVVGKSTDSLHNMSSNIENSYTEVIEEFTINSFFEPMSLTIFSKRYGLYADQRRSFLEYYSINELADHVTNNLARLFSNVKEVKDVEIDDDMDENVFKTTYHYEIDDFWIDGDEQKKTVSNGLRFFRFEPVMIYDFFNESSCKTRNYPIQIDYPIYLDYKVIFHFPKDILIDDDIDVFENETFYYKEKIEQIDLRTVQIDYTLKTLTKEVSAEKYAEFCKQKKEIKSDLAIVFFFYK